VPASELMMAFRMAGESQIIDRLFGLFAKQGPAPLNCQSTSSSTREGAKGVFLIKILATVKLSLCVTVCNSLVYIFPFNRFVSFILNFSSLKLITKYIRPD